MSIIIKTQTEDYIYEGNDLDSIILESNPNKFFSIDSSKTYQILTQMMQQGQVGFSFLRMDQGIFPFKNKVFFNKNVVMFGEVDENSQFYRIFNEAKLKESAKKANIIL
jgi:hypothetical protein